MKKLNNNKKTKKKTSFDTTIFRVFGVMAIMMSSILFLTSCADSANDIADKKGGVTANQIIENPSAYVGKTVTVSGDVEEVHGPRAFNMDSGASVGELLVVGREPFPNLADANNRAYVINDVATVTGVIRMLDGAKIKDEIGWDLDPNLLSTYNGKPVLVVTKAAFRPGKGGAATTTVPNADQSKMDASGNRTDDGKMMSEVNDGKMNDGKMMSEVNDGKMISGDKLTDVSVWGSTADKTTLVGKNAEFSNLKVVRIVGPRTFTVDSGKGEIYVMLDDNSAKQVGTQGKIDIGDKVNLTGEFQRLNMEEIKDTADDRFRPLTATEREFMQKTPVYFNVSNVGNVK